jgi:CHAT domain-containing protein
MLLRISFVILLIDSWFTSFCFEKVVQTDIKQDSLKAIELISNATKLGKKDEPEKALESFKESLILRKRVFGNKHYRLGSTYMGMAIQYKNMHQLDTAYKYYRIAEEMYLFNGPLNDSRLGDVYSNIGNYYQIKGDLSEAIRYQERAVNIYENSSDKIQMDNYLDVVYNLANAYYMVHRENDALNLVLKNYHKWHFSHAINYKNLMANIYDVFNDFKKSKIIHKELINKILKEYGETSQLLADQYLMFGMSLKLSHNADSAILYLKKSESIILNKRHNERDISYLYQVMGSSFVEERINSSSLDVFQVKKRKNLETAITFYKKALFSLGEVKEKTEINSLRFKNSNFPMPTLTFLFKLGETYHQLSMILPPESKEKKTEYLKEAIFYAGTGCDFAEYLRTTLISESSKMQFTDLQKDIFTIAVKVAFELYQLTGDITWAEKAFQNTERKKAASLYDQMSEMQSRSSSLIPDSLNQKETRFGTTLSWLRERLINETNNEKPDSAKIFQYKARIFETEQQLLNLRQYLENNFSDYYQSKYVQKPLTFDDIQKKIKPEEVVFSYSLNLPDSTTEGSLFIFVISKKSCQFMKQPVNFQTIEDIKKVYAAISNNQFLRSGLQEFSDYCVSSFRLYQQLIYPFREMIRDKSIMVIPDGLLSYLPFEALLTNTPPVNTIHFYDLPYLILDHPVSYSYSSKLMYLKSSKHIPFITRALAFSPVYPFDYILNNDTISLPAIPGIYEEVNYLRHKVNTVTFSGEKATEKKFREESGKFDILHLAMHTLINDSLPMLSRLAFSQGNRDSLNNDGWLTTSDIYNLHFNAKMVVLSACRSGSGNFKNGEGIMSLARGFFYAGCPSVLMSLWDVEDLSASRIMKSYYRNLKQGKTKDRALQEAKIMYLKEADPLTSHPHFWLGMIVIGNPEPLFHGYEKYFLIAIGILLLILTIDLVRKKPAGKKPAG